VAKLTDKQKRFCEEYLIDLNATQAYLRAGYKVSENVAAVNAARLLQKPHVQEYIAERQKELQVKTAITQERVLQELAAVAFADIADFARIIEKEYASSTEDALGNPTTKTKVYQTVELALTDDIPVQKRKAIAGIKQGANGIEIKLGDKVRALEDLGKHLGLFSDKVELSGSVDTGAGKLDAILEQLKHE